MPRKWRIARFSRVVQRDEAGHIEDVDFIIDPDRRTVAVRNDLDEDGWGYLGLLMGRQDRYQAEGIEIISKLTDVD